MCAVKSARSFAKLLEQLTHTGDGVCAADAHQRVILWNKAASSLLGYTPAEVLGKPCYAVIQAKDCDGKIVCQKDCAHIERAKKFRWQSHQNFQVPSKGGETVLIDVTSLSILSPQRQLSALVHIFRQTDPTTSSPDLPAALEPAPPGKPMAGREETSVPQSPLSQRELAVLRLLAEGQSTREIGSALFLSPVTVRNHIQNVLRKLQVHTRLEAILWAIRRHLV